MGEVVDLNSRREHVVLEDEACGTVHVVPLMMLRAYAAGHHDLCPELLRAIVSHWLGTISPQPEEPA